MDTVVALPLLLAQSGDFWLIPALTAHRAPVQGHSPAPYVVASMMEETHATSL